MSRKKYNTNNPKLVNGYCSQRLSAKKRKVPFNLTFDQWVTIWNESGHWHERGRRKGQYVMARLGDKGAYEVGNVKIITVRQNHHEFHLGRKLPREHVEKVARWHLGKKRSKKARRNMSLAHQGKVLSFEHKSNIQKVTNGASNPNALFTWSQVQQMRMDRKSGETYIALSRKYGCKSATTISNLLNNRTYIRDKPYHG